MPTDSNGNQVWSLGTTAGSATNPAMAGLTPIGAPAAVQLGGLPGSAADTYAALTRQQWADYLRTFVPFENSLISYATDTGQAAKAMAEASRDVNASFDARSASTQRRLRGMGLSLDADEQRAADRSTNLARSLADVGAQNSARDLTLARQQSILGLPSPQLKGLAG
ncbi:hypothetical protein ABXN37_19840 [Piscinibacter sakaiensis]|uniref:Uncharacterized protein n=1 Tax=Piscinibacter sakaiensis TaxID=1547922 RepID=A0A0K8P432_PISS1|nr:hypothetical protein [Piscinibacter sakaiensis]GAP37377.1 hypothetical protein ISF6_3232 [Piscinibacter sakaiensis]